MIHVFAGTKAQFIKMAPIMQELDRRGIKYNFIDAGQHAGLTGDLVDQFGLRRPDVFLRDDRDSIETLSQALVWTGGNVWRILTRRMQIRELVFRGEPGICLIHGDTLTTLLSLLYAKRCRMKVAHLEAGLRSYDLLNPFPEEIIRLIAMRYSDILFAPSDWAFANLKEMGYADKAINAGGNTIIDAVRYARDQINAEVRPSEPYVVATVHRVETLYSRDRMEMVLVLLERIAQERKVLFVVHEPTRARMARMSLYDRIVRNPSIDLLPLQRYISFISLLDGADFVVTDGGSVQEETCLLGVPCLIMRSKSERLDGLGTNAHLADFDRESIQCFLDMWPTISRNHVLEGRSPSKIVVDHILNDAVSDVGGHDG